MQRDIRPENLFLQSLRALVLIVLLSGTSCLASLPPVRETAAAAPGPIPTVPPVVTKTAARAPSAAPMEEAGEFQDFTLHYKLQRPTHPQLTYQDVSLNIFVGTAADVRARANGQDVPVQYDPKTGMLLINTSESTLDVAVEAGEITHQTGQFTVAALKDNRQWAWSHSFDDNVFIEERGVPAFDQYGWRATVYLIGSKIDGTRDEAWILDKPDIVALLGKGWGIGNHSWSHANVADIGGPSGARQDIIRMDDFIHQAAAEAGHASYHPIAFAAPNFDSQYHPVILELRDERVTGLLFNESGDRAILRVDPAASDESFAVFDPDAPVGRDWRIDQYGTGNEYDQAFRADLEQMLSLLDGSRHYWLNTFTHDVDNRPEDQSIFGFMAWLYATHGPGGSNSVWVAPAEEIYSYLLLRSQATITFTISEGSARDANDLFISLLIR